MTIEEHLDYLAGQIGGLEAGFSALARTHPAPAELAAALIATRLKQQAVTLPTPAPESFVRGQDEVLARLVVFARVANDEPK